MKRINIVKLILTVTVGGATVETIIAIVRKFANTIDYSLEWGVATAFFAIGVCFMYYLFIKILWS
jgi:hypothetical protein